jgi:polar amino acid transport system permease protein
LAAVGLTFGFIIGWPVSIMKVYGNKWVRRIALGYTEFFRGTPLLVQLFVIYYGFPQFGFTLSRFASAYLALSLNSGAYQAEYFRGAIQAIGEGQMMAARGIGMNKVQAIWHIILPQAFRYAIPSWTNEMISMVKYTSIVYLIAVPELMTRAQELASRYFDPLQTYSAAAFVYLILVGIMTVITNFIEKSIKTPGFEVEMLKH